jgi:DNA-directed RNA polymerase specialized sigma24 family protein
MNGKLIESINQILYPFIKKILMGTGKDDEIIEDTNDVLQESWRILCEKYPHVLDNDSVVKALLFTIAKREALLVRNKKINLQANKISYISNTKSESAEQFYDVFVGSDIDQYLNALPANYAFILKFLKSNGESLTELDLFGKLAQEFKERFGSALTIENFRQLKSRARRKILELIINRNL